MFTSLVLFGITVLLLRVCSSSANSQTGIDNGLPDNDINPLYNPEQYRSNLRGSLSKHFIFSQNLGFDQEQLSQIRTFKAKDADVMISKLFELRSNNIYHLKGLSSKERMSFKQSLLLSHGLISPHMLEFGSALD